jgi:hypothetical protein
MIFLELSQENESQLINELEKTISLLEALKNEPIEIMLPCDGRVYMVGNITERKGIYRIESVDGVEKITAQVMKDLAGEYDDYEAAIQAVISHNQASMRGRLEIEFCPSPPSEGYGRVGAFKYPEINTSLIPVIGRIIPPLIGPDVPVEIMEKQGHRPYSPSLASVQP